MSEIAAYVTVRLQNVYANLREREDGQTLVEYGLIIAAIAVLLIVALLFLKDKIADLFSSTGNKINSPAA
jgi:Flp pilus assembly pilin Flp